MISTDIKFGEFATFKYGKMPIKTKIKEVGQYPIFSGYRNVGYYDEFNVQKGQLIIVARGVGGTGDVKLTEEPCFLTNLSIAADIDCRIASPKFLYYYFSQKGLRYLDSGSAQSQITISDLEKVIIQLPPLEDQLRIESCLGVLDDKFRENETINHNLEQQAFALFDHLFPNISDGLCTIGDYITPKRGRNLLSKDAVPGTVPVVAGGLEPSTYHNTANTLAPVLTISASGANAGFVNLWHTPVWSSDSSFIDSSMTEDVYFWFVMLKKRQREIFDAQTGSAQPHIYPQHIAAMTIRSLDKALMSDFASQVTPLFALIGANKDENDRLASVRDALLPKLMSGEIDVSEVEL